jgi:hypothetical protein
MTNVILSWIESPGRMQTPIHFPEIWFCTIRSSNKPQDNWRIDLLPLINEHPIASIFQKFSWYLWGSCFLNIGFVKCKVCSVLFWHSVRWDTHPDLPSSIETCLRYSLINEIEEWTRHMEFMVLPE